MTTSTLSFDYQPLVWDDGIRVIKIVKGSFEELITCKLKHVHLQASSPPKFVALSYVWGNDPVTQRIILNGNLFLVNKNLHAALRRLRELDQDWANWSVWIDAICINQKDIPERDRQILRMADIYSSAKVVAFLGENSVEDDAVIYDIFELAKSLVRAPSD